MPRILQRMSWDLPEATDRDADVETPAASPRDDRFGLYGPTSEAWRLNREATILLGAGPRALLLQLAHPLVAEGVDQHSAFRENPWGRLEGTLRSYLRIVYGSLPEARAEIRRLAGLHRRVTGPVRDPVARAVTGTERYRARDPELSLWVHATLVDSTMVAADAWLEPLSRRRRADFYAETRPIALAFGIPDSLLPRDIAAFETYLAAMLGPGGPVQVTATARELSETILHPPLSPLLRDPRVLGRGPLPAFGPLVDRVPRGSYDFLMWPAVALLPASIREGYDIPWTPWRRLVSGWLVAGFRIWRPRFPTGIRCMPQALAADRRVAAIPDLEGVRSRPSG